MSRRRISILVVAVAVIAGFGYFEGPSFIAKQNNQALHVCADHVAPTVENARIEWRAGFPSGWWCQVAGAPEDTYLFWWN